MKDHKATYILDEHSTAIANQASIEAVRRQQALLVLHKQLVISLKFHHGETLAKLPLEMALQAMAEVWESCNPEDCPPKR
jgi:hypothetical protein